MATHHTGNFKHLTLSDRANIEIMIEKGFFLLPRLFSPESLEKLDKLISPLLKQGQPLAYIYLTHKEEINCSQRTLYNYIDQRYFSAVNLDLPRKVSYKPRKNGGLNLKSPAIVWDVLILTLSST